MAESEYVRSPELLTAASSRLLIVDMQQKLLPAIQNGESVVANNIKLVRGAGLFDVPASATEQYPRGLGPSVDELAEMLPVRPEKLRFSSCEVLDWAMEGHRAEERFQIVVAGIEAHVCVLQSVFDLMSAGFEVFVVADAIGSRKAFDREIAIRRMSDNGARLVTTEMVLFEWCEAAGGERFKEMSRLIR